MNDQTRMTGAVKGYRQLASELVDKWGDLATEVAATVDADQYDAEEMLNVWVKSTRLSMETGFLLWNEAMEAAQGLSGHQYGRDIKEYEFESPIAGAKLELEGLLLPHNAGNVPLVARVRPRQLAEREINFTVYADATNYAGDTYIGKVRATRGGAHALIDVFVIVA